VLTIVVVLIAVLTTSHRASSATSRRPGDQTVVPKQFTPPNAPASTPPLAKNVWAVEDAATGHLLRGSHAAASTGGTGSRLASARAPDAIRSSAWRMCRPERRARLVCCG